MQSWSKAALLGSLIALTSIAPSFAAGFFVPPPAGMTLTNGAPTNRLMLRAPRRVHLLWVIGQGRIAMMHIQIHRLQLIQAEQPGAHAVVNVMHVVGNLVDEVDQLRLKAGLLRTSAL